MIPNQGSPVRASTLALRFIFFVALSILLMAGDRDGTGLRQLRSFFAVLGQPIVTLAELPARLGGALSRSLKSANDLQHRYDELERTHQQMMFRLQRLEALENENTRLLALLDSARRVTDRAMVAGLVAVSQESFARTIIINKGTGDGVYVGQPVLDAYGIMGQITSTNIMNSHVTLITDPSHAIPAQLSRTGLRIVAFGTGDDASLEIRFLTPGTDIKAGDLVISSGMGGRFPPRYPVARVLVVNHNPNEAFLHVTAKPVARVNHNREVLLVWPGKTKDALIAPSTSIPAPQGETKPTSPQEPQTP